MATQDTLEISISEEKEFTSNGSGSSDKPSFFRKALELREISLLAIILVMVIVLSALSQHFLEASNFRAIARGFSLEALVVIGMTFLLVAGVFDLSVGSIMALSGFVCVALVVKGIPLWLAILAGMATGAFTGSINGLIITKFGVNPLIVTFGMMSIARGVALVSTHGQPIRISGTTFNLLGRGEVYGIPVTFFLLVVVALAGDYCMRRIRFFRQLYFIGGNENAAELTGINVKMVRVIAYVAMGVLAATSGMLSNARLEGAIPTAFMGVELKLIVAAVIGGCSLNGGEGSIFGSILGLILLYLLTNGMTLIGISMYWESVVLGAFLIIVLMINMWSANKQKAINTLLS